jgi:excisionase family DNA binding protein
MMNQQPDTMTVRDLASLLRVTDRTVRRWVREGHLPRPMRVRRTNRWLRGTVMRYLAERGLV